MTKSLLRKVSVNQPITDYLDYKLWLGAIFHESKMAQGTYSYAEFSTDLSLGSSNAHMIIKGSRKLTAKAAEKIAAILQLNTNQKRYLLALVEMQRSKSEAARAAAFATLQEIKAKTVSKPATKKQLDFFLNWYNAAILEILRLPNAKDDPEWIAKQLIPRVPLGQIKSSLGLLEDLGLIKDHPESGRKYPTQATVSSGDEVRSMALMGFHGQMIDLAKRALNEVSAPDREISSVTMAIPASMFADIKQEIIQLRKKLIHQANNAVATDAVVQLNFQLFPIFKSPRGD